MELNLTVKRIGQATGTVGWLATSLRGIEIGATKSGTRAAWMLVDAAEGQQRVCIVLHDPYGISRDYPAADKLDILPRHGDYAVPGLPWAVTDAAWATIESLAAQVRDVMESDAAAELPLRVTVQVTP
jgi:hypothetical protein